MARQKGRNQQRIDNLHQEQRRLQQQRTLITPENVLNRITYDAQGRIVYGNDGLIALSANSP